SVDECPRIRAIEMANMNGLLKTRIEVIEVDAMLAAGLRHEWLPMRRAPAGLAAQIAQRPVAPDVLGRVFRMSFYPNRSELVVHPESAKAPAEGTVALGRLFGGGGQREANCTAVT